MKKVVLITFLFTVYLQSTLTSCTCGFLNRNPYTELRCVTRQSLNVYLNGELVIDDVYNPDVEIIDSIFHYNRFTATGGLGFELNITENDFELDSASFYILTKEDQNIEYHLKDWNLKILNSEPNVCCNNPEAKCNDKEKEMFDKLEIRINGQVFSEEVDKSFKIDLELYIEEQIDEEC